MCYRCCLISYILYVYGIPVKKQKTRYKAVAGFQYACSFIERSIYRIVCFWFDPLSCKNCAISCIIPTFLEKPRSHLCNVPIQLLFDLFTLQNRFNDPLQANKCRFAFYNIINGFVMHAINGNFDLIL